MKTVDAFEAVIVNFLTASSVLDFAASGSFASSSSFAGSTAAASVGSAVGGSFFGAGATEALLPQLPLRAEGDEGHLSGASGGRNAFLLDAAVEGLDCFAVTASF